MDSLIGNIKNNFNALMIGDFLYYVDSENSQKWQVVDLFEGGFEAMDDYESKDFYLNDIQNGWVISNKTMQKNNLEFRTKYL